MTEINDWNQSIIEEFRANAGKVGGRFEGVPVLLLHTTGAKTGQPRVNPVAYQPDGDRLVVFASYAGAPATRRGSTISSPAARPPSRSARSASR